MKLHYHHVFFAVYGIGPWECMFCREQVVLEQLHVHHIDHDDTNNLSGNLAPTHGKCHHRHHFKITKSAEHRKALAESHKRSPRVAAARAARKNVPPPDDVRRSRQLGLIAYYARQRASAGQAMSSEARENMRLGRGGYVATDAHRAALSKALTGKIRSPETRARMSAAAKLRGNNRSRRSQ